MAALRLPQRSLRPKSVRGRCRLFYGEEIYHKEIYHYVIYQHNVLFEGYLVCEMWREAGVGVIADSAMPKTRKFALPETSHSATISVRKAGVDARPPK